MKKLIYSLAFILIIFGNLKAQIPEATSGFQNPLSGAFSNNEGYSFLDTAYYSGNMVYHPGEDWNQPSINGGCSTGCNIDQCLDVLAAANGQVKYVQPSDNIWGGIVIQHNYQGQTWYSHYGHVIHKMVVVGQNVIKGQKIAEIGNAGTTCAHLHFEIREADHPQPTNGEYFQFGSGGIGNYNNVVDWYESPNLFIPSHPAYNNSNVNCTFSVNNVYSLNQWKFWKTPPMPTNYYTVTMLISGLGDNHWALYTANSNGVIQQIIGDQTITTFIFQFAIGATDPRYPNSAHYSFWLLPQGDTTHPWVISPEFCISTLPILSIWMDTPSPLHVGSSATVKWSVSGGVPTLDDGGWTGNIRLQWYKDSALTNLASILVAQHNYPFTVPGTIPGGIIPGCNFKIGGANAPTGTSIPDGYVSAFTGLFCIENPSGIIKISNDIPTEFSLQNNYPNPFNPTTNIKFDIAKLSDVKIVVYDMMGREVQTLVNESLKPGTYETSFDGSQLTSGVYFYKITAGDFSETKKMLLVK